MVRILENKFKSVIDGKMNDPIKNYEVILQCKEGAVTPMFLKARAIPYKIKDQIDLILKDMVREKIISPVENSSWASPIIVVPKPNNEYRVCINPKKTINPVLADNFYPIPKIHDLFVEIGSHEYYTLIDLKTFINN